MLKEKVVECCHVEMLGWFWSLIIIDILFRNVAKLADNAKKK